MGLALDRRQVGAALRGQRAQQRRLAARARAQVEPALVRALERGVGESRGRRAASPRPAHRRAPGRRRERAGVAAGQPHPDRGVRRARGALGGRVTEQLLGRDQARPRDEGDASARRCRRPAGPRARRRGRWPPATRPARRRPSGGGRARSTAKPWRSFFGSGASRRTQPARSCSPTRRSTALTKPVTLRPADLPGQVDGGGDRGVRRHPGGQQLVGAQPQHGEHRGVDLLDRASRAGGDHRVVGALASQRAGRQLGGAARRHARTDPARAAVVVSARLA